MEPLKRWSTVSYSWTQPYTTTHTHEFYSSTASVDDELERLARIDRWIDCMHTYPDAQLLLEKYL